MPNGGNPLVSLASDFLSKNVTKIGVVGGMGYFACTMAVSRSWREAVANLGYLFLMLLPLGASMRSKRNNDMLATTSAEAIIGRSVIANAVTPETVTLLPTSTDPAVQREIDKRTGAAPASG